MENKNKKHKQVKCKINKAGKKEKKDFGEQFSKDIKIKNTLICQIY